MSTPAITKIQYTSKDFATLRNELLSRIAVLTNNRWTDINESDPGVAIVELLIAMSDEMLFYLDQSANEAMLPTAVQRRDVQNLVKLIDYAPASVTSAAGKVTFDPIAVPLSVVFPITIPPYTRLTTAQSSGVSFVTTTEDGAVDPTPVNVTIIDRNTPVTMNVVQGKKSSDTFTSDATGTQIFQLGQLDIDTATVLVSVNGTPWNKVTSFVSSDLNSEDYLVSNDAKGHAFVTFGDGQFGMIPPDGATIVVSYVVSDGDNGTVGAGKISILVDSLLDNASVKVTGLSVGNADAPSPGLSPESIERTKLLAPALLAALFTAKSKDDYNALVQAASTAVTKVNTWGEAEETPPNYKLFNKVQIAFAGKDTNNKILLPGAEFDSVKAAIIAYLNSGSRKIITTRNVFIAPEYVDIVISGTVYADLIRVDPVTVLGAVKRAIWDAFGYDVITFGQDIYPSQIQNVIAQVPGVVWSQIGITAVPTTFDSGGTRYQYDTSVLPNIIVGVTMKKFEIPIVEDDADTGRSSGITHIQLTVADAINQPSGGDTLNNPCAV